MRFTVNPADELPIYRQIMRQVMDAVAGGRLAAGDRLPSHRELSEQIVVAPLTVKKAYDELEAMGYLESRRGTGTFVSARLPRVRASASRARLATAARALVAQAYLAGLTLTDVVALVREAERSLTDEPASRRRKEAGNE